MKKYYLPLLITLFLFCFTNRINAQNSQTKLDQVQLFNNLLGNWQSTIGKDSIQVQEYKSLGNTIECNIKIIYNNKILYSSKQVWEYDKVNDKFIGREITSTPSEINLYSCRFTSKNILEGTVKQDDSHSDYVNSKIKMEFKSTDLFVLYLLQDDMGLMQIYKRKK